MVGADDDRALLARIAARDEASLGALYERYSGLTFSLLLRIVRDREVAEELLQETFYHVWRGAATFDAARGPVSSWLVTIARNRGIDELRRRRREPLWAPRSEQTQRELLLQSDPQADVAVLGASTTRRAELARVLEHLPEAQRKALELVYFEGLSHAEIAARVGEPLGTVKTRIRLGLRKLRELMNGMNQADYID